MMFYRKVLAQKRVREKTPSDQDQGLHQRSCLTPESAEIEIDA